VINPRVNHSSLRPILPYKIPNGFAWFEILIWLNSVGAINATFYHIALCGISNSLRLVLKIPLFSRLQTLGGLRPWSRLDAGAMQVGFGGLSLTRI
jgi:hypothetical protein